MKLQDIILQLKTISSTESLTPEHVRRKAELNFEFEKTMIKLQNMVPKEAIVK
jgi:hypothetical protein